MPPSIARTCLKNSGSGLLLLVRQLTLGGGLFPGRAGRIPSSFHCGSVAAPIQQMGAGAQQVGAVLKPPAGAGVGGEMSQPAASRGGLGWRDTWWWGCCPMKGAVATGRTQQTWIWPCSPAWVRPRT